MFFYMTDMTVKPEASYSTHHNIRAIVRAMWRTSALTYLLDRAIHDADVILLHFNAQPRTFTILVISDAFRDF